jgi:hypothetical protein
VRCKTHTPTMGPIYLGASTVAQHHILQGAPEYHDLDSVTGVKECEPAITEVHYLRLLWRSCRIVFKVTSPTMRPVVEGTLKFSEANSKPKANSL